jgi:hypothetical protein
MARVSLKLGEIRADGGTQVRVCIPADAVEEYTAAYEAGTELPDLEVIHDGRAYWLWDGFTRLEAMKKAGKKKAACNVREGTLEDARWLALSANRTHGVRRTNADKRRAVEAAVAMHPTYKDRVIADHCGVSNTFVGNVRHALGSPVSEIDDTSNFVNGCQIQTSCRDPETNGPRGYDVPDEPEPEVTREPVEGILTENDIPSLERLVEAEAEAHEAGDDERAAEIRNGRLELQKMLSRQEAAFEPDPQKHETNGHAPAVVLVDELNVPLSEEMVAVWEAAGEFDSLVRDLRKIQGRVHDLAASPAGRVYAESLSSKGKDENSIKRRCRHIDDAISRLKWARPHSSHCPYCHEDGRIDPKCIACGGQGWVTRSAFDGAATERKEAVLALAIREE